LAARKLEGLFTTDTCTLISMSKHDGWDELQDPGFERRAGEAMVYEYLRSPFGQSTECGFDSLGIGAEQQDLRRHGNSWPISGYIALEEDRELISMAREGRNSYIEIALSTAEFAPAPVDYRDPHMTIQLA
jgi:hypothetical protein